MWPWFWIWSPQLHFPFGGSVAQSIAPDTDWFFGGIRAKAGNGATEQRIHEEVASYGRQLGLVTEVLLSLAGDPMVDDAKARESLARLRAIRTEIEDLKKHEPVLARQAAAVLQQLVEQDPATWSRLLQRFAQAQRPVPHRRAS